MNRRAAQRLTLNGVLHEVEVVEEDGRTTVLIDGKPYVADMQQINGSLFSLLLDGRSFEAVAVEQPYGHEVVIGNDIFEVGIEQPVARGSLTDRVPLEGAGSDVVRSPMTGVVVEVVTTSGASVVAGQVLVIVESMKMNNELRAPRDGIVETVHVQPGARVERNATLVTIRQ